MLEQIIAAPCADIYILSGVHSALIPVCCDTLFIFQFTKIYLQGDLQNSYTDLFCFVFYLMVLVYCDDFCTSLPSPNIN